MCYATLSTGLLRYTRNDSRFFVHVSPADFVLAATFAYRSVSLRASVAQRGNPVNKSARSAFSYVPSASLPCTGDIYMCYATLSTGLLRYTRNDSRFFCACVACGLALLLFPCTANTLVIASKRSAAWQSSK